MPRNQCVLYYGVAVRLKRARTGGGEADEEPVPVADGFEAPIFGARVVGLSRCQLPRLETQRV